MRKNKYNAKKVTIDGITFDSRKEGARYSVLKILEMAEQIHDLKLQPKYEFEVNGVKICTYKADFSYIEYGPDGDYIVEDCKGFKTPIYRLKKKMMLAFHGIKILET